MPTVTKMHFIEMLKEHVGLSRAEANEVVDSIFDEMQQALSEGREIKLATSRLVPVATLVRARLTRSALGAW